MIKHILTFLLLLSNVHAGNYYVSVEGGFNHLSEDLNSFKYHKDFGEAIFLSTGYSFKSCFRMEVEVGYRHNKINNISFVGEPLHVNGHYRGVSVMANALWDFIKCPYVTPFIGGGVGYVVEREEIYAPGLKTEYTKKKCALQGLAGISYPALSCLDIALTYRFFKGIKQYSNQSLSLGLLYKI
jgi:opacity protein-like surface antigen